MMTSLGLYIYYKREEYCYVFNACKNTSQAARGLELHSFSEFIGAVDVRGLGPTPTFNSF